MRILITILFFLVSFTTFSQEPPFTGTNNKKASKYFGVALQAYSALNGSEALMNLKKALAEDPNFVDAILLMADLREQNEQYDEAIELYEKAISIQPAFQIPYYKLAYASVRKGAYQKAVDNLALYKQYNGTQIDANKVERIRLNAEFGAHAVKNPVPYDPKNAGPTVNTMLDEYCPGVTADEHLMVFTRYERNRTEDFYVTYKQPDGSWSPSKNMGPPINTELNEGTVSLSADGQYVFFAACNRQEGEGSCDIYFSALDGDTWKEPRNLGFPVNTRAWESQPTISSDGRTLYFASNRAGGYGEIDIWYSTYSKGRWSPPVNMGPDVNTPGNDESPFIARDDKTLYFSSDGHTGMGMTDLFVVRKDDDGKWGKPENLGYPINTPDEERILVLAANGKDAYISGKRPEGFGGLDIYTFELYEKARPAKTGYVKGYVYDAKTNKKLKAKLELTDLATGKVIIESSSNKLNGEFLFCLQGNKDYALNVSAEGYLFYSDNFALKNQTATDPLILNIPLNPIMPGERVVLKNVFFDVDKFTLRTESRIELDKLVAFMKANPTIRIELGGHTDNTGIKQKNTELSNNRAKAVFEYLVQNGVGADRLSYKGYGDTQPVADNKTEAGKQQNRRTEFKIISK